MDDISDQIDKRLTEIECENDIQILYACESGSRAWGFASPDSDFDIRFVFKRPLEEYLVLKDPPDILEYPIRDNFDFNGWDLKKFLLHIGKSNGVMFEWLQSPVTYRDKDGFRARFQAMMKEYFDPRRTMNHYLGLARRTLLDFEGCKEVKLKKYFYILRPLLAARWIRRAGSIPPMEFDALLSGAGLDEPLRSAVLALKRRKELSDESQLIERDAGLDAFAASEMCSCESMSVKGNVSGKDIVKLDAVFMQFLKDSG